MQLLILWMQLNKIILSKN